MGLAHGIGRAKEDFSSWLSGTMCGRRALGDGGRQQLLKIVGEHKAQRARARSTVAQRGEDSAEEDQGCRSPDPPPHGHAEPEGAGPPTSGGRGPVADGGWTGPGSWTPTWDPLVGGSYAVSTCDQGSPAIEVDCSPRAHQGPCKAGTCTSCPSAPWRKARQQWGRRCLSKTQRKTRTSRARGGLRRRPRHHGRSRLWAFSVRSRPSSSTA